VTLWRTLKVAISALSRNKVRSMLTVLGIVIGVGAVIAMVSIGEGAKARVASTFAKMGTNRIMVRSGASHHRGARGGAGSQPTLTWSDLEAIRRVPGVRYVAPRLGASVQLLNEYANWRSVATGTTPDYLSITNWSISAGEMFRESDVLSKRKVVVVGKTVVEKLYGVGANPVGRTVRINNIPFKVVGILEAKGSSAFGTDQDDVVMVPSTTFIAKIAGGLQKYIAGSIEVSATSQGETEVVHTRIQALLRQRHRIRKGDEDDFHIRVMSDIANAQAESAKTITSLLAGVALVSLLVGGIGIMNIMLVSVTERTREIGLRMAVGAKPRNIMTQFLVEATALSLVGGVIGVALGVGAAMYLSGRFGWPLLIRADIVVVAAGFSALVGIAFGSYPARKASHLDPIQALRYE
jgi:putative ABC transport system permease protein